MAKAADKQQDPAEAFAGGTPVEDKGVAFPGRDPWPGMGVMGRVAGYTERPSTFKDQPPFAVCQLEYAALFLPSRGEGDRARLLKVDAVNVAVGRWIAGTLTERRFPVGSLVKVTYEGMQGRAKEMKVFTLGAKQLTRVLGMAESPEPGELEASKATEASGDDDLPF